MRVTHLTLDELQNLKLKGGHDQRVPTLKDVLDMAREAEITKPLVVEIKYLKSDRARIRLIELVSNYKESFGDNAKIIHNHDFPGRNSIQFLAFTKKFKGSFPNNHSRRTYCQMIKSSNLGGIYKAGKHEYNHCQKYYDQPTESAPKKKKKKKWWKIWRR